jgi:molecular chaperone DnaK
MPAPTKTARMAGPPPASPAAAPAAQNRLGTTQPYGSRQASPAPPPPFSSDPDDTTPGEIQPDPASTIPRPLIFDEVLKAERGTIPITPRPIVGLTSTQPMAERPVVTPTPYPPLPIYGVAATQVEVQPPPPPPQAPHIPQAPPTTPSAPPSALAPAIVAGRTATQALSPIQTPLPPSLRGPVTPVLVDVTPRALVVETVGGWCDVVVQRNAKIPCERTRAFTTSSDMQSTVRVRVAQGEDATFGQNTYLGEVELTGLRAAPRGQVTIQVRFEVDESGTLKVFATDAGTGREAHATLQLVGIAGAQSISSMAARNAGMRLQ